MHGPNARLAHMKSLKLLSLLLLSILTGLTATVGQTPGVSSGVAAHIAAGATTFSPSNARTQDVKLIPVEQFFPSSRFAACHKETHAAWSESLHRNAGREPFYKESVDILEHTRGSQPTQHCESCHAPVS